MEAVLVEASQRAGGPVKAADLIVLMLCQDGFTTPELRATYDGRRRRALFATLLAQHAGEWWDKPERAMYAPLGSTKKEGGAP